MKTEVQYCLSLSNRWAIRKNLQILEDLLGACMLDFKGS